jgi:hypothetical protein
MFIINLVYLIFYMNKISNLLLSILIKSYILSFLSLTISLPLSYFNIEGILINVFGSIGLYGLVITSWLLILHLFSLFIDFMFRQK